MAQRKAHFAASTVLRQQSRRARLVLAVAIAALSAAWVKCSALLWLSALLVTDHALSPRVRERFVRLMPPQAHTPQANRPEAA